MSDHASYPRILGVTACAAALVAGVCIGGAASAGGDSCREWVKEHCRWKAEVMRRHLHGATQNEVDTAVFEMLQREAYLTSCDPSAQGSRDALVGWRLVDKTPDDYAGAVLEAVLERSGFRMDLRERLSPVLAAPPSAVAVAATPAPTNGRRSAGPRTSRQGPSGAAR